ncbi:MAG: hypothetical protein V3S22_04310 [Candidatus Neomarinimicrobiota bacterium]
MDLKDKLDIIWKYSILAIILISLVCFHTNKKEYCIKSPRGNAIHGQCLKSGHPGNLNEMKIKVEKKIVDGDTTTIVWVNGKKVDNPEEFLAKHGCGEHGPDCTGKCEMKKKNVIKKKIHKDEN